MAWPESLSSQQQATITAFIDQVFRPAVLQLVKALSQSNDQVIPGALASPSGASSTFNSPASDSILGLLNSMTSSDVVPFSSTVPTGLALAQQLTVADVISYLGGLNTLIGSYWQLNNLEAFSLIVGSPNVGS